MAHVCHGESVYEAKQRKGKQKAVPEGSPDPPIPSTSTLPLAAKQQKGKQKALAEGLSSPEPPVPSTSTMPTTANSRPIRPLPSRARAAQPTLPSRSNKRTRASNQGSEDEHERDRHAAAAARFQESAESAARALGVTMTIPSNNIASGSVPTGQP